MTFLILSVLFETVQYSSGFTLCELDDVICNVQRIMIGY